MSPGPGPCGSAGVLTGEDIPTSRWGFIRTTSLKKGKVCSYRTKLPPLPRRPPDGPGGPPLIEVVYDPLPAVFDPRRHAEGAPWCTRSTRPTCCACLGSCTTVMWRPPREAAFVVSDRFRRLGDALLHGHQRGHREFDPPTTSRFTPTPRSLPGQKDFMEALGVMGLPGRRVRVIKPCIGGGSQQLDTYATNISHPAGFTPPAGEDRVRPQRGVYRHLHAAATITRISQGCDATAAPVPGCQMILDNGAYTSWAPRRPR